MDISFSHSRKKVEETFHPAPAETYGEDDGCAVFARTVVPEVEEDDETQVEYVVVGQWAIPDLTDWELRFFLGVETDGVRHRSEISKQVGWGLLRPFTEAYGVETREDWHDVLRKIRSLQREKPVAA